MSKCKRCKDFGQPDYFGSPVKCAFESGTFSSDNWQCQTALLVRELADDYYSVRDDMRCGSLGVVPLPEAEIDGIQQGYVVMSWYKDRGTTGQMWVMWDEDKPEPLTLNTAEFILEAQDD